MARLFGNDHGTVHTIKDGPLEGIGLRRMIMDAIEWWEKELEGKGGRRGALPLATRVVPVVANQGGYVWTVRAEVNNGINRSTSGGD